MGLFDDILKKPTPPAVQVDQGNGSAASSGSSGTQGAGQVGTSGTPLIVKSESSTLFGPESEAEKIRLQNAVPTPSSVHAEEDASSVLVGTGQSSAPIAPVAPVPEPMVVTPIAETSTEQATTPTPVVDPPQATTPIPQVIPNPAVSPVVVAQVAPAQTVPTVTTPETLNLPTGPSLFDHIMGDDAEKKSPEATPEDSPAPVGFSFDASTSNSTGTSATDSQGMDTALEAPSKYATPREFIEKSLENIDTMLDTIEERHTAKMTEAEGYRMEKMRFAELEKNAYAEAEIMDRERDHTLRMKSIFEKELDTDEANRTRKTSAHQDIHTNDKHGHAHSHSHKRSVHEEEDVLAAS